MSVRLVEALKDCLANAGEPGAVFVESEGLMTFKGWVSEERARANFEVILTHIKRLPKPFLNPEGGWTFLNLPFYDNGHGAPDPMQQWGEQRDAGLLVLVCSYFGIVQDNLHALGFLQKSLDDLPGGVSYFAFNTEESFLNLVRNNLRLR